MHISILRAARISGKNRTDSVRFFLDRNATRYTVGPRSAHGYHFQRLVRVFSSGAGPVKCWGRYVDDRVRFGHQSVSSDSDDFDSTDNAFGGLVSRFDICTDYTSSLYFEYCYDLSTGSSRGTDSYIIRIFLWVMDIQDRPG